MDPNKNIIKAFVLFFLFGSIIIFSQTLQLESVDENKTVLIKQNEYGIAGIFPSSGINYSTELSKRILNPAEFQKANSLNWELKFSASGKVFKDISFATPLVGYIVTELGAVYKTIDGGNNWTNVMYLGFPYYWYGVDAITSDTVVISGFNNQGNINSGVVRWSFDGGISWTNDIILKIPTGVGWLSHIHFFDSNRGIVSAEFSGGMHYTNNGGKDTSSWTYIQVNSDLGWFAGNIDTDSSGNVFTTGIHFAKSSDYGINWLSGPPADNVFDGGVDFLENLLTGMTGGGQISAPVSGWVHKTTDNGQTWSQRLFNFPYPIRAVKIIDDTLAMVFGGNLYQEAGGIYISTDGGLNWSLELNSSAEMFSYDVVQTSANSFDIWCVGSTGGSTGFIGKLYKTSIGTMVGIKDDENKNPKDFELFQNHPNPFNPVTSIHYAIGSKQFVSLKVYDVLGNEIAILVNEDQPAGKYEVEFNASSFRLAQNLTSGIYFYKLKAGEFVETKKMILLK